MRTRKATLLRFKKTLYRRIRRYARLFSDSTSPSLTRYRRTFEKECNHYLSITNRSELFTSLTSADIVLCGDYHTLGIAQRTATALLEGFVQHLQSKGKKIVLALELASPSDQTTIQKYLEGETSDDQFLQSIRFESRWGFPWQNYRPLFQLAKEQGYAVHGINRPGSIRKSLHQRDRFAAREIVRLSSRYPDSVIFVLFGDWHLAPSHLPTQIELALQRKKMKRDTVIIHQNIERIYWRLATKGLDSLVDMVRMDDRVYCLLNTPPWIKLHHHVNFLESTEEDSLSSEITVRSSDPANDVAQTAGMLIEFFGFREKLSLSDFDVKGPNDHTFLNRLGQTSIFSPGQMKLLGHYLRSFESFFVPEANILYFRQWDPDEIAMQATIYLHSKISRSRFFFEDSGRHSYSAVWIEALGFLGSMMMNPKRKAQHPRDWERSKDEVALMAFSLVTGKPNKPSMKMRIQPVPTLTAYESAKKTGQWLGIGLYKAFENGEMTKQEVRGLFADPFLDYKNARALFFEWKSRIQTIDPLKKVA